MAATEPQVTQAQSQLIKDIFAQFAPILADVTLTPEKLREALKPYVDPAVLAREMREREMNRKQFLENQKITLEIQARCPHKDKNERWAINVQHNFPDHQPRGICPLCFIQIEPAHWVIPGAGFDGGNGLGQPYVVQEHPLYHVVRFLESQA
jgi:hypothetical protein